MPPPPRKAKLTEGPVAPLLLRMTGPMVIGIMANMLFNIVDTFFVSRLGARPLAAMGFTFPVVFFVTGSAMGMGVGVSSVVARAIGEQDPERVRRLVTDSLLLAIGMVLGLAVLGWAIQGPLFRLMGAEPGLLPLIRSYMTPWFCGIVFLVVPMVGNSALRATGDTLTPSLLMLLAGGVNVLLDPLLIFGIGPFPRLELTGAAIATGISYLVVFIPALFLLWRREHMIQLAGCSLRRIMQSAREVLYVAFPAILTNQMNPLAMGLLTRLVAAHGESAVGAFGVGSRIESLAMSVCFALSTAMAPFVGQNFGAGNWARIKQAVRFGACYCFGLEILLALVLALSAAALARLFTGVTEVQEVIICFLLLVPWSYGAFGFMLQLTSSFNALYQPGRSAILFSSRFFLFIIPFAWLGNHFAGLPGLFLGLGLGNLAAAGLGVLLWRRALKKA